LKKKESFTIQENTTTKYKLCHDGCDENTHKDWHLHFYCKICKQTTCKEDISFPENIQTQFRIDEIRLLPKESVKTVLKVCNSIARILTVILNKNLSYGRMLQHKTEKEHQHHHEGHTITIILMIQEISLFSGCFFPQSSLLIVINRNRFG
jgi:hypothetical protein